jgi:gas vesicle protein
MNTKSKIVVGILGAAAAGVVIGLLVAPEKGSDVRKKLRKTAGGWADSLGELWTRGKAYASDGVESIKNKASQANS